MYTPIIAMIIEDTFTRALEQPIPVLSYSINRELSALYPERYVMETQSGYFDLKEFERDGHCHSCFKGGVHSQLLTEWHGAESGPALHRVQTWMLVNWKNQEFEVIQATWPEGFCNKTVHWIVAANREVAEAFYASVCSWCSELRGEVLVYEQSYWRKSRELYDSVYTTTYDQITLAGDLKQRIHEDFTRFFGSRDTYARYGVPWKRGALFIGPPGNGKTQMVKAVINAMGVSCLYVKSFSTERGDAHANVREVFDRARQTTPCFLVLEDLDSLVNTGNRSFFLNELDGFASNTGIVVLATTNHPEKLDPAILDRPSRFDRKYYFNLPEQAERAAYLEHWNANLEDDLKLSQNGVLNASTATDDFSFAYLKELMLSSIMAWMDGTATTAKPIAMDAIVLEQAQLLRDQMVYMVEPVPSVDVPMVEDDEDNE